MNRIIRTNFILYNDRNAKVRAEHVEVQTFKFRSLQFNNFSKRKCPQEKYTIKIKFTSLI
jgi:hypothetical protein